MNDKLVIDEETEAIINKFLTETDWDSFWEKVYGASREEVEAYRKASAKSSFGFYAV